MSGGLGGLIGGVAGAALGVPFLGIGGGLAGGAAGMGLGSMADSVLGGGMPGIGGGSKDADKMMGQAIASQQQMFQQSLAAQSWMYNQQRADQTPFRMAAMQNLVDYNQGIRQAYFGDDYTGNFSANLSDLQNRNKNTGMIPMTSKGPQFLPAPEPAKPTAKKATGPVGKVATQKKLTPSQAWAQSLNPSGG